MNILITGATGQLGSKIVDHVLNTKKDENIFVSVRNVDKAKALADRGVTVRHGDFDDVATLDKAFDGIDRLVIVSTDGDTPTRIKQHANALEAAKNAGVKLVVYTSLTKADTGSINLNDVHRDTEKRILDSGLNYKILRNNWYLENEIDSIKEAQATGTLTSAYGKGKVGWMTRDEYAKAAAAAVLGAGADNTIYTLSNTPVTIDTFAEVLAGVLGKPVTVNHVADDAFFEGLKGAGLPEGIAQFVLDMNKGIQDGSLDAASDDYETLTKEKPLSLEASLKDLIAQL